MWSTLFGANVEYVHCINMMPFTPATEDLLPRAFIKHEYPTLATSLSRSVPPIVDQWKGYVYEDEAVGVLELLST